MVRVPLLELSEKIQVNAMGLIPQTTYFPQLTIVPIDKSIPFTKLFGIPLTLLLCLHSVFLSSGILILKELSMYFFNQIGKSEQTT